MHTIVHAIRLLDGVPTTRFEDWVVRRDYAACPELPSVIAFSVQRAENDSGFDWQYFEVIQISEPEAFERDMQTPLFLELQREFSTMAAVVGTWAGCVVEPSYRRKA